MTRQIVVVENGNKAAMFKTMVHEVAHALLHGGENHHAYAWNEVEAESTAFVESRIEELPAGIDWIVVPDGIPGPVTSIPTCRFAG